MGSINDMLNRSNGLSTDTGPSDAHTNTQSGEANTNTEPIDEDAELVQNYLDIFRGATPDSLRGSIQDCEEGMKRDIEVLKALWRKPKPVQSGGGLRQESEDTAERLDRRIRGMRAVAEAMKGLLEDAEDKKQSQELEAMKMSIDNLD
jgi:hypothetical protein